jgi:hypothetical protein
MTAVNLEKVIPLLADEAQALLLRESQQLVEVRDWLQGLVSDWSRSEGVPVIDRLEKSSLQLAEQRKRFRTLLARGLSVAPADATLSLLMQQLSAERRQTLATARSHVLRLTRQVAQLSQMARLQANDIAVCLQLVFGGANSKSVSVERYDGRGIRTTTQQTTLLNDRC